jgi:predicted metal-dependent hydrolase
LPSLPFLQGYPPELLAQAKSLIVSGRAVAAIRQRYPEDHQVQSNKKLFSYVQELKAKHLRHAAPLGKVSFEKRLASVENALGLHVTRQHQQGARLQKRREVHVASLFKHMPAAFLRMIVVHELAHMKHSAHDRAFYKLCCNMEPEYHQLEFDLRLLLSAEEHSSSPDSPTGSS